MTQPLSVTGSIVGSHGSSTINATVQMPYNTTPSVPPTAQPILCFICVRQNRWMQAVTVYQGTYLCQGCAIAVPNALIIDELTLA